GDELVHADDGATVLLDFPLLARGGLGDLALQPARLETMYDATNLGDLLEQRLCFPLELVGQSLDVVRAAQRIGNVWNTGLVREHLLRAKRNLHRLLRGQRQRLVHRVGVQRLRAAEHRGHRLIRDAHDVVHRLLRGERHTGCLRVESHDQRARILRAEALLEMPRPDASRGTQLRDLLEEIIMDVPEERQTGRKVVHVQSARKTTLDVRETVRERERKLLRSSGTGFPDVIARDRDRIPERNVLRRPLEVVDDETQRRLDGIHPRVLRHVLLEDVVLDRTAQFPDVDALLLCRRDVKRKQNHRWAVDGHRRRDLVERNALEKRLHVGETRYRDAALANLAL